MVILTMHAGRGARYWPRSPRPCNAAEGRAQGGRVGRPQRRRACRADATGARLGIRVAAASSICSSQFAVLDEGIRAEALHAGGVRAGSSRARGHAPRALHRGRHGGQPRREVAVRRAGFHLRGAPGARSSSCCCRSGSSRSSTGTGAASAIAERCCPTGRAARASIPSSRCSRLRISRSLPRHLRAGDRLSSREPQGGCAPPAQSPRWPRTADELTDRVASIEPAGEEDVFDLTEDATHHFVADGLVVHNCSRVHVPRRHRLQPRVASTS